MTPRFSVIILLPLLTQSVALGGGIFNEEGADKLKKGLGDIR